jgi:hypothetical protein
LADGRLEKTIALHFEPEDDEDKRILKDNGGKVDYYPTEFMTEKTKTELEQEARQAKMNFLAEQSLRATQAHEIHRLDRLMATAGPIKADERCVLCHELLSVPFVQGVNDLRSHAKCWADSFHETRTRMPASGFAPDQPVPKGSEAKDAWLAQLCKCTHARCYHGEEKGTGRKDACKQAGCICKIFTLDPAKVELTVDVLMDDKAFLKAFMNHVMSAYVQHGDDCFACESGLWNSYPFTMMEELTTLHAMRPGGEVQYNTAPAENFEEMKRTAQDWRKAIPTTNDEG